MATHTKETLLAIIEKIRYDTTAIQANVTELARAIAALPLPEPKPGTYKCSYDGLTFPNAYRLGEHLHNVHDDHANALNAEARYHQDEPGPIEAAVKAVLQDEPGALDAFAKITNDPTLNSGVALSHARAAEEESNA